MLGINGFDLFPELCGKEKGIWTIAPAPTVVNLQHARYQSFERQEASAGSVHGVAYSGWTEEDATPHF